jgi:hypothetical protein
MKRLIATLAVLGLFVPAALASTKPYVKVNPTNVTGGNQVKVHGVAPSACKQGSNVKLFSNAFKNAVNHSYNGTPAAFVKIGKNQTFSKKITIDGNVAPKTYKVKARCNNNTFAHTNLTVSQFYP